MRLDREDIPKHHLNNRFFEKPEPTPVNGLTIFIAVLAAILVAFFLREAYLQYQIRQAAEMFAQRFEISQKQFQQNLEANRRAQLERIQQQKLAQYRVEQQKQAAISAGIQERRMKNQAWERFYKPIKGCESSNDDKDLMKCGNDHLKAKTQFEKLWASGQFR
jgi:hypothetical protein